MKKMAGYGSSNTEPRSSATRQLISYCTTKSGKWLISQSNFIMKTVFSLSQLHI